MHTLASLRRLTLTRPLMLLVLCAFSCCSTSVFAQAKYEVLFNGHTLDGWKGAAEHWSVEDGAIVGETRQAGALPANTFLIWQGGEVSDFDFRCKVRFQGNNSGVQYRSKPLPGVAFGLQGYQADLHPKQNYFGMLYSEKTGRGILAERGQRKRISSDSDSVQEGRVGDDSEWIDGEWNDLRIIAVGNRLVHQINGSTTIDVIDEHPDALKSGLLGLQLHRGPAMKVEFRGLLLRKLSAKDGEKELKRLDLDNGNTRPSKDNKTGREETPRQPKSAWLTSAPTPQWIWTQQPKNNDRFWFRHSFNLPKKPIQAAKVYSTCDNRLELRLNDSVVGASTDWGRPLEKDVVKLLRAGPNQLAAHCRNEGSEAGFLLKLVIDFKDGTSQSIVSDSSWKLSAKETDAWGQRELDDRDWPAAVARYPLGKGPWGIPGYSNSRPSPASRLKALEARHIMVPPGFLVERIYSVPAEQGSWVALTTDPKGRIYASDQGGSGLYRVTLKEDKPPKVETVSQDSLSGVSGAQGLLWAYDSLWFHRNGGNLQRLTDQNGDDKLDSVEIIPSTKGGGEHGNHAVILTEDDKGIYMNSGNHAPLHDHVASRVPSWSEDLLLPRMWDARGHARGKLAPGGWITRLNPETLEQTVHAVGFRNQYDIALNRFGDLFTYDADMEWDLGLPWYRPTRICQPVSGAEFGWRSGSGKWPSYYEDSLPPVVEIGPGSPTGVVSAAETAFPTRYRDGIFALDWTFGTIYAVHLKPKGAGYTADAEHFVYSSPLPVTDAIVKDGDLYFAVGGRGTQSALFRVKYVGHEPTQAPESVDASAAEARKIRRKLESFHARVSPDAIETAWPKLNHPDRFIRYAARIAVESQPVRKWSDRVFQEQDPRTKIVATIALARSGEASHRPAALKGLVELDASALSAADQLKLLRGYALCFIRLGRPTESERKSIIGQLEPLLPQENGDVNTELVRVLTYLKSPAVIAKTIELIRNPQATELPDWSELASRNAGYGGTVLQMLKNHPPTREIGYAFLLRNMRSGWKLEERRSYFEFLNKAAKSSGGASYSGYLSRIRDEALGNCSNEEREALMDVTGENFEPVPNFAIEAPKGPGKPWTTEQALAAARNKPNFENGRSLYFSAKCASCHRLRGLGGNIGPDLTSVPNKFDQRYVVEAIVEPSKDISDQYGTSVVLVDDGRVLTGLAVEEGDILTIYPMQPDDKPIQVPMDEVEEIRNSPVSQMPRELLNTLNAQEIADLVGYIMAAGDPARIRK